MQRYVPNVFSVFLTSNTVFTAESTRQFHVPYVTRKYCFFFRVLVHRNLVPRSYWTPQLGSLCNKEQTTLPRLLELDWIDVSTHEHQYLVPYM